MSVPIHRNSDFWSSFPQKVYYKHCTNFLWSSHSLGNIKLSLFKDIISNHKISPDKCFRIDIEKIYIIKLICFSLIPKKSILM